MMIRLILLISLSSAPLFLANAQNLTETERRFLGTESNRYLNAYRYPQRHVESGSSSTHQLTNQYLNQKIKRGSIVVKSNTPPLEPVVKLSELPTVEMITLPSDQPASDPASLLPSAPAAKATSQVAKVSVARDVENPSLAELKQQEQQLQKTVTEMSEKAQVTVAPVIPKTPVAEKVEVVRSPIPVNVTPEAVVAAPVEAVPAEEEADSDTSKQVDELRALIEKLKQTRQ